MIIEDLTEFSDRADPGFSSVRVVQQVFTEQFDMSCTDSDDSWTCAPGCLSPSHGHVRMMTLTGVDSTEIILDSGADIRALFHLSMEMLGPHANIQNLKTMWMHRVASSRFMTHALQVWI